ncbi:MAG: hypothetical protein NTW20_02200 [Rhodobacterales bacterium]|nr:hypothetical protein [Rhodobacterales bacterium]
MSKTFKSRPRRLFSSGAAERGVQPRRFAALVTGGAVAVALVLGAALPAKADSKDDLAKALIAALVVGALVNELTDEPRARPVLKPAPARYGTVPSICAITIDGSKKSVTLFAESCLRAKGFENQLPQGCANTARIFGRFDRVYSEQCLHDAGFRVSRR